MAVLIKRYENRKLYNTQTSRYITLKGISELLEDDEEVQVIDNESGEDITSVTLSQILVDTERSNRAVPGNLLSELVQRLDVRAPGKVEGLEDPFHGALYHPIHVRRGEGDPVSRAAVLVLFGS